MKRKKRGLALRALVLESMAVAMMFYLVTPESAHDTLPQPTTTTRQRPEPQQKRELLLALPVHSRPDEESRPTASR